MKDAKNIEEIFKEKLHDLESPVRADLWTNVAAQAGIHTGFWSVSKVIGFSAATVLVSAALWFAFSTDDEVLVEQKANTEVVEQSQLEEFVEEPFDEVKLSDPVAESPAVKLYELPKSAEQNATDPMVSEDTFIEEIAHESSAAQIVISETIALPDVRLHETANEDIPDNVKKEISGSEDLVVEESADFEDAKQSESTEFEPAERLDLEILIAPEKREEVSRESKHYPSAFPRIFNPNVSGDAASFSIEVRDVSYFKVDIKNQKGQLVFSSTDPNFVWKGTRLDGSPAPEGTYLFLIESNDLNGQALKPQSGAVFLMR